MKKTISIIGGGSSALILACQLNTKKYQVTIYERNASLGRKFLVAGDGGLNLTHSETEINFIKRYTPFLFLKNAYKNFTNSDFISWMNNLGIETFVGTSGRVFPKKGIKPIEVLNAFLNQIKKNNVAFIFNYTWQGFSNNNHLILNHNNNLIEVKSDYTIFCLGGASWPITGSKGDWTNYFKQKNIIVNEFKASNCAFKINWEKDLIKKIEGKVLKNISITCGDKTHFGEAVLTKFGIEGSGIYPLSPEIREKLVKKGEAEIIIDFKPNLTIEKIIQKLKSPANKNGFTNHLKTELNLSQHQIQLIKGFVSKEEFLDVNKLAKHLKYFKLIITETAPITESISTVGGISLHEINSDFELKKLPNHFIIGEMLDYDAPTGGYLLQSCFSMGKYLADYLNGKTD